MLTGIGKQSGESVESVLPCEGFAEKEGCLGWSSEWVMDDESGESMEPMEWNFSLFFSFNWIAFKLTPDAQGKVIYCSSTFVVWTVSFLILNHFCSLSAHFVVFSFCVWKMKNGCSCCLFHFDWKRKMRVNFPHEVQHPLPISSHVRWVKSVFGRRQTGGRGHLSPVPLALPSPNCPRSNLSVGDPTPSYCPLICYWHWTLFFQIISHVDVTVPTLEFDYLCTLYMNFLFSPVIVSFYFSSMAKLRFVNCCFRW